ncbi:hypothetical protein RZS08_20560, partial [Arthrospira platensis SPKY1]|nr:hypothetical protein [Arthrospira platensis SPKY1]
MNAHIAKPFDLREVVQTVRQMLDRPAPGLMSAPSGTSGLPAPAVLDDEVALQRLGGDRDLLYQL